MTDLIPELNCIDTNITYLHNREAGGKEKQVSPINKRHTFARDSMADVSNIRAIIK